MAKEKIYPQGVYVSKREGAPEFVICSVSIKIDDFAKFVKEHKNEKGYLNIDILQGKENPYAVLNTFEPKKAEVKEEVKEEVNDLPF
jgi:hypothetical protein